MVSQKVQKIFVTKSQTASIICNACEQTTTMSVSKFMGLDKVARLKFNCKCGYSFPILLERRTYVRKNVTFKGTLHFQKKEYSIVVVDIVVMDMSRYGLKLKLLSHTGLKVGQNVVVDFFLDDKTHSKVSKEVIIRNINPPHVGVEFLYHDHFDKFGAYILFHFGDK